MVLRFPSRSSRVRLSSLASSKACNDPNRSIPTSSTVRPSSSAVSYARRRRIIRHCEPGPPAVDASGRDIPSAVVNGLSVSSRLSSLELIFS